MENNIKNKELFIVFDKLKDEGCNAELNDFQLADYQNEKFYPLLVNQYKDVGMVCYKMKKVESIEKALNPWE